MNQIKSNQIQEKHCMLQATIPFEEIASGASARLAIINDVQYLSIRDVLMHIYKLTPKRANEKWNLLSDTIKSELTEFLGQFRFPGPGNPTPSPVITFKGVLKLIMLISGEKAALYRSAMVKILQRYYAGDESLSDEIEANAQSTSSVAQLARASLEAEEVPILDEISLARKRKLEELEIAKLEIDIETKRTEIEAKRLANHSTALANRDSEREYFSKLTISLRELCQDTVMDERSRLILKDNFLNLAMLHAPSAAGNAGQALLTNGDLGQQNKPVSLSMIAVEMGMKVPSNELISIGAELKKRYVAKHGKEPSKHDQLCNGRMTKVNSYMESDRPMIEEVLRWHASGRK